jgi:excisionase family DNA binding protein
VGRPSRWESSFRGRPGSAWTRAGGWRLLRVDGCQEREILTPQEAADFLRVPLLTVQRQAKAGRLPGRRVGKEWRFSRSMLREWVAPGPDQHDLELYDRRARADTESGPDEEEQP